MPSKIRPPDLTKERVLRAASEALEPIVDLLLHAGVGPKELAPKLRHLFVTIAGARIRDSGEKPSISRIAAATGLTRPEVHKLLTSAKTYPPTDYKRARAPDKILLAWRTDPDYLEAGGTPKALKYTNEPGSFCELTSTYAPDIPPRALLKELLANGTVEKVANGSYLPAPTQDRLDKQIEEQIATFGLAINQLANSLIDEIKHPNAKTSFNAILTVDPRTEQAEARLEASIERRCKNFAESIQRHFLDVDSHMDETVKTNKKHKEIGVLVSVIKRKVVPQPPQQ